MPLLRPCSISYFNWRTEITELSEAVSSLWKTGFWTWIHFHVTRLSLRQLFPFVKKASSFLLEVSNNFADNKFGACGQRFIAATMETQRISTSFSYKPKHLDYQDLVGLAHLRDLHRGQFSFVIHIWHSLLLCTTSTTLLAMNFRSQSNRSNFEERTYCPHHLVLISFFFFLEKDGKIFSIFWESKIRLFTDSCWD